jgi:Flp pilus assembly protein protease CpaA
MWLPFLIAALPIAFADVKTFTIPNVYLWWLTVLCSPILILRGFGPIANLVAIGLILTSLSLVGLGMGDVKLISIILIFSNSDVQANLMHLGFLCLSVQVVM